MALAKPLHLRLFLEGQEVPVISASVQAGLWAPATASIQVVPLDEALYLKPRTMVHLFWLEEPLVKNQNQRQSLAGGTNSAVADDAYKLLFAGEVVGFNFMKQPMARAVVLQCMDFSSYWDAIQATMMDYGPEGNAFVSKASIYASDSSLFANIPTKNQMEVVKQWLNTPPSTPGLENVGGLAGGVITMMEMMGGLRNATLGVNDFFTIAELRCHLLAQLTAEDNDNTAKNLFSVETFWAWIYNQLANMGPQVSLRDLFKMLCQFVYYSIAPNPVAKFDAGGKPVTKMVGGGTSKASSNKSFTKAYGIVQNSYSVANTDILKTQDALSLSMEYQNVVKLLNDVPELATGTSRTQAASVYAALNSYAESAAATKKIVEQIKTLLGQLNTERNNKVTTPAVQKTFNESARLRTQIFRPDCYMAAPPACNVIFPEMYSAMNYDRQFLGEVTRVEISYHSRLATPNPQASPNKAALTAQHILMPDIYSSAKAVEKKINNKWRILMQHELHTGIIAREEWLPDSYGGLRNPKGEDANKLKAATLSWQKKTGLHHFFKYRIGPRTIQLSGRFMPYLVSGFPALIIQRPFYLESSSEQDALKLIQDSRDPSRELGAPPQFLGMIESLTHQVAQDGGLTSLAMSHCRTHLGIDDEFVGTIFDKVNLDGATYHGVNYVLTYAQAKEDETLKKFLHDLTPQQPTTDFKTYVQERKVVVNQTTYNKKEIDKNGNPTIVLKTVDVSATSETAASSPAASKTSSATSPVDGRIVKVPNPEGDKKIGMKGLKGKIQLVEVLEERIVEDGQDKYFSGVRVYEQVAVPFAKGKDEPVPVEYIFQPSWLSTSYDNEMVGPKVYQPFFGCDSIVDTIMLETQRPPPRIPVEGLTVPVGTDAKTIGDNIKSISRSRALLSIERSVNYISYLYGKVRSEKLDVDEFITSFVRRPVASKKDLLGSYDLELKVAGSAVTATKGSVGFHTLSVHPDVVARGNLVGLMDNPVMQRSRMNSDVKAAVAADYDVRAAKLKRVLDYVIVMTNGARGFTG